MSSKHEHSEQHEQTLKKQALQQQEVGEVLIFFRRYLKPGIAAIVALCALALFIQSMRSKKQTAVAAAGSALMNAATPGDLEHIVATWPNTPIGPIALMKLARETYNGGSFAEAESLFNRFLKTYADHELARQAELNLIACKESAGHLGEAHLLYGEFAKSHAGTFLAPMALMGQARCLEALGMYEDALMVYDDILTDHGGTEWARNADAHKKVLRAKIS